MKKRVLLKLNKYLFRRYFYQFIFFIFILIVWEYVSRSGYYRIHLFPPPTLVAPALYDMMKTGELLINLKASAFRWFSGFTLGFIFGIFFGFFTGRITLARTTLGAMLNALSSIPKVVLIPLAILWFGLGEWQKITLVAWGSFFPIWLSTQLSCEELPSEYKWTAQALKMNSLTFLRHVLIPHAVPFIISGMRIAISTATFALAAAEMAGAFSGIAHQVFYSHEMFQTDRMMAGIFVITIFSFSINEIFIHASILLFPWIKEKSAKNIY